MNGVLQVVPVERGRRCRPAQLARVADPSTLKAIVRISETQTRIWRSADRGDRYAQRQAAQGPRHRIDPLLRADRRRRGVARRADPPRRRPDLSVDGRLSSSASRRHQMSRPALGQRTRPSRFSSSQRMAAKRFAAGRFGRAAVTTIEVVDGLKPGDQVILSDMSQYDSYERVRIR